MKQPFMDNNHNGKKNREKSWEGQLRTPLMEQIIAGVGLILCRRQYLLVYINT